MKIGLFFLILVVNSQTFAVDLKNQRDEGVQKRDECLRVLESISSYLNTTQDIGFCVEKSRGDSRYLTPALEDIINLGLVGISEDDKKFISESIEEVDGTKESITAAIEKLEKNNKDVKEAKDFLKAHNIPLNIVTPNENPRCANGASALAYDKNTDSKGMRVEVCIRSIATSTLSADLQHEVLHIKQNLGLISKHSCKIHITNLDVPIVKKYTPSAAFQLLSGNENFPNIKNKEKIEEEIKKLFEVEKFFYIDYSGSEPKLTPKKPDSVTREKFEEKLNDFFEFSNTKTADKNKADDEKSEAPLLSAEIKKNKTKKPIENIYSFFNKTISNLNKLKEDLSPEELVSLDKYTDTAFNGQNRIIPSLNSFCSEQQAFLNEQVWKTNNYLRMKKLIPACDSEFNPYAKNVVTKLEPLEDYEKEIDKKAKKSLRKGTIYANDFSLLFGFDNFPEIFNSSNCQNPPQSLWRYKTK